MTTRWSWVGDKIVRKSVENKGKKRGTKRTVARPASIADANARFDRLLEAMAKASPLANKKKRVAGPPSSRRIFRRLNFRNS